LSVGTPGKLAQGLLGHVIGRGEIFFSPV